MSPTLNIGCQTTCGIIQQRFANYGSSEKGTLTAYKKQTAVTRVKRYFNFVETAKNNKLYVIKAYSCI